MKNILTSILSFLMVFLLQGCQRDDFNFGTVTAPANLSLTADIVGKSADFPNGDGSGKVVLKAKADNAITYKFVFSDGTSEVKPTGVFEKRFATPGVNTYTVLVIASGKGGVASSTSINVDVRSDFKDEEAVQFLTGGTSKKWYFSASEPGHLGVGPNSTDASENFYPKWYSAAPWEKQGSDKTSCLYENELTFSLVDGQLKYELNNHGSTFFNAAFNAVGGGSGNEDLCLSYNTSGQKTVLLVPSESVLTKNANPEKYTRGTVMNISDNGFMGYYINSSSFEILSITDTHMKVRAIMNGSLAWYFTFTTTKPVQNTTPEFKNLIFEDNFDTNGAPNPAKWTYDLGSENSGWGNNEKQYYTNNANNVKVENGSLKITARKESSNGFDYTSARLKSKGLFDFKYGKVEVRAKLPSGGGTWPAIWMLGSNIETAGWPNCGEIDIMEHIGNEPNKVQSALHYPGNSGGNPSMNSIVFNNIEADFHIYKLIWTDKIIQTYVDDKLIHTFQNTSATPFNQNFFLLLNVAMGGNLGGTIDPNFTQSTFEIDYVKVFN